MAVSPSPQDFFCSSRPDVAAECPDAPLFAGEQRIRRAHAHCLIRYSNASGLSSCRTQPRQSSAQFADGGCPDVEDLLPSHGRREALPLLILREGNMSRCLTAQSCYFFGSRISF